MKKSTATKLRAIGILLKPEIQSIGSDHAYISHKRRLKRAYKRNAIPGIFNYLKGVTFKNEHGQGMANVIIKSL